MAGPGQGVAGGEPETLLHPGTRLSHEGADVAPVDIHIDPAVEAGVLAAQHGGLVGEVDPRHIAQRNARPVGGHQGQQGQGLGGVAIVLGIAQVDGVTLAPLYGLAYLHAADGGGQHRLHIGHVEAVAGGAHPIDIHLDVASAGDPLGIDRRETRHRLEDPFDIAADALYYLEIGPGYLDADRGLDAGGQHVDAGLDGRHPGVGETGEADQGVEFLTQLLWRHTGAPLVARLELNAGLEHHQIGRVGGAVGPPRLAEHVLHLGHGANELVGLLQQLARLAHREIGVGGGHVHQIPLVELGHELRPQVLERVEPPHGHQQGQRQGGLGPGQHRIEQGDVSARQGAVEWVGLLGQHPATDEVPHQHGHQGNGQGRGRRHGIGLGVGERGEHAPLLGLQGKDRQEAHGDDEQGEEDGGPHLYARLLNHLPAVLVGEGGALHVLVDVLDHHDGAIHHGADGDGDAAQRHDVGVDPLQVHNDEGDQDGDGQAHHHHQRGAQVEQEGETNQHHHHELLHQLAGEVVDGALDEIRAVIDGDQLHPLGQAGLQIGQAGLDPVYGLLGVLAVAHDDDAADHLPLAVELGHPAPHLRARAYLGHVPQGEGGAAHPGAERDEAQVLHPLEVAIGAHHVLGLGHLDDRRPRLLVARLDGTLDKRERHPVGAQLVGVNPHLILLDHAPDGRHLGDTGHRLQLILEKPVLQRGELSQIVLAALVDQGVLIDPAHPGGVGTELGLGLRRQARGNLAQVLQHPGAGPVEIGLVVEQHIDEGVAKEGVAAHRGGAGHRQQRSGEGIGDLILDHLGRLPRVAGLDDHLHVREIRQSVDRGLAYRPDAPGGHQQGHQQHQEAVAQRPANDGCDHAQCPPCPVVVVAAPSITWMAVMR